jgi:putative ABC transport system permease protein
MIFKIAARNLLRNSRRTFVTIVTVATGVAGLFAFQGFNTGIMNQYRENAIHIRYGFGQIHTLGYKGQVYEKPHDHWIPDATELITKISAIPGVTHVLPRIEFFALLTNGNISLAGQGLGIDGPAEKSFFNRLKMSKGEALGDHRSGVVLGAGLARSLSLGVGDTLTVLTNTIHGSMNGSDLTVVGIYSTGIPAMDDHTFQIQLAEAQQLLDTGAVETITLGLKDLSLWDSVTKSIVSGTPGLEATPFHVLDKVIYQNGVDFLEKQFRVIRIIVLLIIVLGIFNTASSAVLERIQEFGNLRANGDRSWDVMRLIGCEAVLQALIGSGAGILLTYIASLTLLRQGIWMPPGPGLTEGIYVFLELHLQDALVAGGIGSFIAVLATMLAGAKVARIPIAAALRSG